MREGISEFRFSLKVKTEAFGLAIFFTTSGVGSVQLFSIRYGFGDP